MLSTFKNLDTLSTMNGVAIEPSVLLFTPDTWTTTQTFTIIQSAMKNEKKIAFRNKTTISHQAYSGS